MENSNNNNEKIIIENKYIVTKELFKKWTNENRMVFGFRIFWILFVVYSLGMMIYCIISNDLRSSIIFGLFALYAAFRTFLRNLQANRNYKLLAKFYKKSNWERRILFFEDHFEVIDGDVNNLKFNYDDIISLERKEDCLKIKRDTGYLRVYKNAFVKSNFEECEEFLNKKIKKD